MLFGTEFSSKKLQHKQSVENQKCEGDVPKQSTRHPIDDKWACDKWKC